MIEQIPENLHEFLEKVREGVESHDLFIESAYNYSNYDSKKEFPIKFGEVWHALGLTRHADAKRIMQRFLGEGHGGYVERDFSEKSVMCIRDKRFMRKKENILLSTRGWRKLRLMGKNHDQNKIADYYLDIEEIFVKLILENCPQFSKLFSKDKPILRECDIIKYAGKGVVHATRLNGEGDYLVGWSSTGLFEDMFLGIRKKFENSEVSLIIETDHGENILKEITRLQECKLSIEDIEPIKNSVFVKNSGIENIILEILDAENSKHAKEENELKKNQEIVEGLENEVRRLRGMLDIKRRTDPEMRLSREREQKDRSESLPKYFEYLSEGRRGEITTIVSTDFFRDYVKFCGKSSRLKRNVFFEEISSNFTSVMRKVKTFKNENHERVKGTSRNVVVYEIKFDDKYFKDIAIFRKKTLAKK